jgi:large subunit ribosomal protein L9
MKVLLVADVVKTGEPSKGGSVAFAAEAAASAAKAGSVMLGWFGDIVEVSSGFARNYLLPQGLAVIPTPEAIKSLAREKARRAESRRQQRQRLEETAAAVGGAEVVIAAKVNEAGHLFGSVSNREIAANLREQGFDVADEMVQLSEHIKQVGTITVKVKFAQDLIAAVNVVVVPHQDGASRGSSDAQEQSLDK